MKKNNGNANHLIIVNALLIVSLLLLVSCANRDLVFTFNNKTAHIIDSIQVKINSDCSQCPQIETTKGIMPFSTRKLVVTPYDEIRSDGAVGITLFKDSLVMEIFDGVGYFSNGGFPSAVFGHDKLKYSIVETDTEVNIIHGEW